MPTDVSGFDPITVSLRDYIDGATAAHENAHARERENIASHLDQHDKFAATVIDDHFRAHAAEHEAVRLAFANAQREIETYRNAHKTSHDDDKTSVKTALEAVERLAQLHAAAHDKEHHSHEVVHQREREAAGLARQDLDARLHELNGYRAQLREQATTFMPRSEVVVMIERVSAAVESQWKAADNAHTRMDDFTAKQFAAVQKDLDALKLTAAADSGASGRTTLLIGFAFTIITILIAIGGIYVSSRP